MTQPYKNKLIEVAIPLETINAASAREKSIRHGHPSTLHLWRPLTACRTVLFAQLVDDPSSLPGQFPTAGLQDAERKLPVTEVKGRIDGAETVMLTRQEIITSLHEPGKYILAIVQIEGGFAREPRYVRGALSDHEPSFEHTAIQFNLRRLLERAEVPR